MRFTISVNQVKAVEWGLNMNQGALMDLINQAYSWAEPVMVGERLYYWMSRNKVISEIPAAYSKPDTVYRAFRSLEEKGLVYYTKQGKRDLLAITPKGRKWNVEGTVIGDAILGNKSEEIVNSEINPSKSGNKSEKNSDLNPTYKNTSIYKNTNNKKEGVPDKIEPTEKQIAKAKEYGIDLAELIEAFLDNGKSKGLTYACWTSAFGTWIRNEIKFNKLVPVANKPFRIDDEDWSNPNGPARYQQPEVYHPSQTAFNDQPASQPISHQAVSIDDPNWRWTEPFAGMSIIETDKYIKAHKNKGENPNKAYLRLLAKIQEQG